MTEYSDFDIKAFRGHFRIASSHFEDGCKQFEKLSSLYQKSQAENERLRDVIRKGEDGDCDLMDRNDLLTTNLQITVAALVDILHVDYKMHPECECVEVHDNIAKEALAKIGEQE